MVHDGAGSWAPATFFLNTAHQDAAQLQALQSIWQRHVVQTLAELIAETQALQVLWESDAGQRLIKLFSKRLALKTAREGDTL